MPSTGHDRIQMKLFCLLFALVAFSLAGNTNREHRRHRRQLGEEQAEELSEELGGEQAGTPINLNTTVPYIFSARLYPYGPEKGDKVLGNSVQAFSLIEPFAYLGAIYDTIYIRNDGAITLTADVQQPSVLPSQHPVLALFWMPTRGGKVFYRQTEDASLLNLAHNEVNIQYRYGQVFNIRSVVVITWEGGRDPNRPAGFSNGGKVTFSLPDSGTADSILLREKSDIGIPGEWLFRVDPNQVYLCGAGFKGLECVESCSPNQWFNDCSRGCHCENGDQCDPENGRCPTNRCSPGWSHAPICDRDIDECLQPGVCPAAQPDCVNTPGAFMCLCFEYDEAKGRCKGSETVEKAEKAEKASVAVKVMPVHPIISSQNRLGKSAKQVNPKTTSATSTTTSASTPTVVPKPLLPSNCPACHPRAACNDGRCECTSGYQGDGETSCEDVDECVESLPCGDQGQCTNTIGSFECTCEQGYRFDGEKCLDKDECAEGSVCGEGVEAKCVNTEGSFECRCPDGYRGDPLTAHGCLDKNECDEGGCGENAECTNTVGGFECECHEGFERLSDEAFCTDIDECAQSPCHAAARCTNLIGSFTCDCIDGFIGNGVECHETILYPIADDSFVVPRGNSSASFALSKPIKIGGQDYYIVKISPNGFIAFSQQLTPGSNMKVDGPSMFILSSNYDYTTEGLVAYTRVNASDDSSMSLLRRAAYSASSQWGDDNFAPTQLHIFTFSRMHQQDGGADAVNSFQAVIAISDELTLLTLLYEKVNLNGGKAMLLMNGEKFELPIDSLSTQSNVDHPGKWMMRIDGELPVQCPAGRRRPPLCESECVTGRWGEACSHKCHCANGAACDVISGMCANGACAAGFEGPKCDQDVDECAMGILKCHENAICENRVGSAECVCAQGSIGNGTHCETKGRCLTFFNRACSSDADCVDINSSPVCQCRPGFHGDGFTCNKLADPTAIKQKTPQVVGDENLSSEEQVDEKPFLMKEWEITTTITIPTTTIRKSVSPLPPAKRPNLIFSGKIRPLPSSEIEDHENLVEVHEKVEDEPDSDSSIWMFVIAPCILAAVWLVLIAAVIGICYKTHLTNRTPRPPVSANQWPPTNQRRRSSQTAYNHRAFQGYV